MSRDSRFLRPTRKHLLNVVLRLAGHVLVAVFLLVPIGHAGASVDESVIGVGVYLSPLRVDVSVPAQVKAGKAFRVKGAFTNDSASRIENAVAGIHLFDAARLAGGRADAKLGTISAHRSKAASWQVKALAAGEYIIVVSATGEWGGAVVSGERQVTLTVTGPSSARWWERILQFISE